MITKRCSHCGEDKPREDFHRMGSRLRGLCKECRRNHPDRSKQPRSKQKEATRAAERRYGVTKEQYEKLYAAQEGRCAICKREESVLNIDHCHISGGIRGLLCGHCNRGIGLLGENVEILKNAIKYLETPVTPLTIYQMLLRFNQL